MELEKNLPNMQQKYQNVRKQGNTLEKHLENSSPRPNFQRNHGKLYNTEKLIEYRRKVIIFFSANLVLMFSLTKEQMKFLFSESEIRFI